MNTDFFSNWSHELIQSTTLELQTEKIMTSEGYSVCYHNFNSTNTIDQLPTLIFLPGFRTSSLFWVLNNQIERLAKVYPILLIDVPGQPGGSAPRGLNLKKGAVGRWMNQIIEHFSHQHYVLNGTSFGGFLALQSAQTQNPKIDRLCLFNPAGFVTLRLHPQQIMANLKLLARPSQETIRRYTETILGFHPNQIGPRSYKRLEAFIIWSLINKKTQSAYPYIFAQKELDRINVPVDFYLGGQDTVFSSTLLEQRALQKLKTTHAVDRFPNDGHALIFSPEAIQSLASNLKHYYPK